MIQGCESINSPANGGAVPFAISGGGQRASFDHAIDPDLDSCRERFEALVSSIRDLLTAGWLRTRQSHDEMNCRGAYYRAMEFLLESAVAENAAQIWGVHPCPIADRDRTTNR